MKFSDLDVDVMAAEAEATLIKYGRKVTFYSCYKVKMAHNQLFTCNQAVDYSQYDLPSQEKVNLSFLPIKTANRSRYCCKSCKKYFGAPTDHGKHSTIRDHREGRSRLAS